MASRLCLLSLPFNQLLSDRGHYSPYPVKWDVSKRRMECIQDPNKLFTRYNIYIIFHMRVLTPLVYAYLLIYKGILTESKLSPDKLLFLILIAIAHALGVGLNGYIFKHRETFEDYVNLLLNLTCPDWLEEVHSDGIGSIVKELNGEMMRVGKTGKSDLIGIAVTLSSLTFAVGAYVMLPSAYFGRLDNFNMMLDLFILDETPAGLKLGLRFIASSLASLSLFELMRTFRIVLGFLLVLANINSCHVATMKRRNLEQEARQYQTLQDYLKLYHVHSRSLETCEDLLLVSYQCGTLIAVLATSVTCLGWKFLPGLAYVLGSFMGSLCLLIIRVAVDYAASCAEESGEMIWGWKHSSLVGRGARGRYLRRVVKTLRPIAFLVKHVGNIDREFKLRIWTRIVTNTQDMILMMNSFIK